MLTEECKTRLRAVSDKITENPLRVAMADWIVDAEGEALKRGLRLPECGTVGCIAGWVVQMEIDRSRGELVRRDLVEMKATRLLGISQEEAYRLFFVIDWPASMRQELDKYLPQTQGYANVVARRIELFIETEGKK